MRKWDTCFPFGSGVLLVTEHETTQREHTLSAFLLQAQNEAQMQALIHLANFPSVSILYCNFPNTAFLSLFPCLSKWTLNA